MGARALIASAALGAVLLLAGPALAAPGDAANGEALYVQSCLWCHGEEGDGEGPGAERLLPRPRDLSMAQYKIKTTGFEDFVPNDADLFRMIGDGMPGSAMPGWSDMHSEQDIWDLVAYIKIFAALDEEEPSDQVDYGVRIASSAESIARGRELFHEGERCSECHGEEGKGDAVKKLKDDNGYRTWPRNLTKPWTFRASNHAKDIFTRITVGIPDTQMPSFADPKSKKALSTEERWHVANFVASLGAVGQPVNPENTVVKADRVEGRLPTSPDDAAWDAAPAATFILVPQIIVGQRFFTPSNDTITVRALYGDEAVAIHLEWDDRTKSIPGDEQAEKIADAGIAEDAVAVQLPVTIPQGMAKPYFVMGDAARPVNLWRWTSGTTETPPSVRLSNGRGHGDIVDRDAAAAGLAAEGVWRNGTWRVVMTRPLATDDAENDLQLFEGVYIPIAVAAWDGSNGESGTKHTLTPWYWLLLKPRAGSAPYVMAFAVFGLALGGQFWWARNASGRRREDEA